MRRAALFAAAAWILVAWSVRRHDKRPLGTQVFARAAAQGGEFAHVAWIEGPTRLAAHGHLVVARLRIDGVPDRHAARRIPGDARDCRVWLEEPPGAVQAVAACAGAPPIRLAADGTSRPSAGPSDHPAILYDLYPLTTFDPQGAIDRIRPHEPPLRHVWLALLALACAAPLALACLGGLARARRLARRPLLDGELPGEPARRVRLAVRRDALLGAAALAIALAFGFGAV